MKTIAQLSKELNISPQALYKKINKQLKADLYNHVHEGEKGQKLIDEAGELIIIRSLPQNTTLPDDPNNDLSETHTKQNSELVEALKDQINDLKQRLDVSQGQITNLTETIKEQQQANNLQMYNLQVLLKQEQEKNTLLIGTIDSPDKKTSFWDRIFKGKKNNPPSDKEESEK